MTITQIIAAIILIYLELSLFFTMILYMITNKSLWKCILSSLLWPIILLWEVKKWLRKGI